MEKLRILVVDDEPSLSELVTLFLERTNRYEVRMENRSACVLAVAHEYQPHAIILDIMMPGKDGTDLKREMDLDPLLSTIPVLFLTSLVSTTEAGDSPAHVGGERFLAKPVNPRALIRAVDELIAAAEAADSPPALSLT
jgi:CheY-like chemotaxis protein